MSNISIDDMDQTENGFDNWNPHEHSTTQDTLSNLYHDFCSLPDCSDRSLIFLMYHVSVKLARKTIVLDASLIVSERIAIENEVECLRKRLTIENLSSSTTEKSINELFISIKYENWKTTLNLLSKIFNEISPLNIYELRRLIKGLDRTVEVIRNKDVIMFLGATGSGKSTAIHFLAGSKMDERNVKGLYHIAPIEIKNSDVRLITTSPFSVSETRYITPVRVSLREIGVYFDKENIVLCDSPGFGDTHGPEVDIANCICIIKAIKGCKSIKPVLLISYKSIGDRYTGLKDLIRILSKFIHKIDEHISCFSYIFTKYLANEVNTIHSVLVNLRTNLNPTEKLDTDFTHILDDMIQKTERNILALDPINDKPDKIFTQLLETPFIDHPDQVFKSLISTTSERILKNHIGICQLSINTAITNYEYLLVKQKLDQLKYLDELLPQFHIKQIYLESINKIRKHLLEEYKKSISNMRNALFNEKYLTIEDLKKYQLCVDRAKLADQLKEHHLGEDMINSKEFIKFLEKEIHRLISNLSEKNFNHLSLKADLDKVKIISTTFPDVNVYIYKNFCQILESKFDSDVHSFKNSILEHRFDQSQSDIATIDSSLNLLQGHLDLEEMQKKCEELKTYFFNYLKSCTSRLNYIFIKEKVEKTDIDHLNKCLVMFEQINRSFHEQTFISNELINKIHENFLTDICNYFQNIVKKIESILMKKNKFLPVAKLVEELDLIRTINVIQSRTSHMYNNLIECLIESLNKLSEEIDDLLQILFLRNSKFNYDRLRKCLLKLTAAKWIENYRQGTYSMIINDITHQIIHFIGKLKTKIMEFHFDFGEKSIHIEKIYEIVFEINEMKCLEDLIPNLNEHADSINIWFKNKAEDSFKLIRDTFNLNKLKEEKCFTLEYNKIDNAFQYLDNFQSSILDYRNDCLLTFVNLEEFIRNFSNFIENDMIHRFEIIKRHEKDMIQSIQIFSDHLKNLLEIKTKYPRIFSFFTKQKIFEDWQCELSIYLIELSDEIARLAIAQRTDVLLTKISVVHALTRLDKYLEGEKFINVYNKYQVIFISQIQDIDKQTSCALDHFDYDKVSHKMDILKLLNDLGNYFYQENTRLINKHLDELIEETNYRAIMIGNNIQIEYIKCIVENLRRMEKAKRCLSNYFDNSNKIDEAIKSIASLIENSMRKYLECIRIFIDINRFSELDEKLSTIKIVCILLGCYCKEDIPREIQRLEDRKERALQVLVQNYFEIDISEYCSSPPRDILDELEKEPTYYEILNLIKTNILCKLRKELDYAKGVDQRSTSNNLHLRRFELALKYLPEAMRIALEIELKHCKDDILQQVSET